LFRDGSCDSQLNTEECGYDGGECCEASLSNPGLAADGSCDWQLNTEDCGYDSGDCNAKNEELSIAYPDCTEVQYSAWFADGVCDLQLNTEECGYDGGDCL